MILDYKIINTLSSELGRKVARNEFIASNIANIDTPGYKSKDLNFADCLSNEYNNIGLKVNNERHINPGITEIPGAAVEVSERPGRADGNNVDVDDEMLKLTKNNMEYNIGVQLIAKKLRSLNEAISQSRG